MGQSKFRRQHNSLSYADANKKKYINETYPQLKAKARAAINSLLNMKSKSADKYIDLSNDYGGVKAYLDLKYNEDSEWEFSESVETKRNCGYSQEVYRGTKNAKRRNQKANKNNINNK